MNLQRGIRRCCVGDSVRVFLHVERFALASFVTTGKCARNGEIILLRHRMQCTARRASLYNPCDDTKRHVNVVLSAFFSIFVLFPLLICISKTHVTRNHYIESRRGLDLTKKQVVENEGAVVPPLTRPPSVEDVELNVTMDGMWHDVAIAGLDTTPQPLESNAIRAPITPPHDEEPATDAFPWIHKLTAAIIVAIKFLLAPLNVRARRGCRGGEGDGDARAPHPSLWKRLKSAVGRAFAAVKRSFRDVTELVQNMCDDSDARRGRLVALAASFNVHDLPPRQGHKRHDSDELFQTDRTRLEADEALAAGVQQVCQQAAAMFPEVGYNQASPLKQVAISRCGG